MLIACMLLLMMGCSDETVPVKPSSPIHKYGCCTNSVDFIEAGMRYKLFVSSDGGPFVINITKDSLEVSRVVKLEIERILKNPLRIIGEGSDLIYDLDSVEWLKSKKTTRR